MKKLFIVIMLSLLFASCQGNGNKGEYRIEEKQVISNNGTFLIITVFGYLNSEENTAFDIVINKYPDSIISRVSKNFLPYEFYVVTPNK